jgi:hypothetical protein
VDVLLLPGNTDALRHPEWITLRQELIARVRHAREVARQRTEEAIKRREEEAPDVPIRVYRPGRKVLIRNFAKAHHGQKARKWLPKFIGPYKILAQLGPTEYKVMSVDNENDIRQYNVNDVKPYKEFALRSDVNSKMLPAFARGEYVDRFAEEWDVARVLDKRTIGSRQPTTYYLIRYEGRDSGYDQWVPEAHTRCPEAIQQYEEGLHSTGHLPRPKRGRPLGVTNRKKKRKRTSQAPPSDPTPAEVPPVDPQEVERTMEREERLQKRYYRRLLRSGTYVT